MNQIAAFPKKSDLELPSGSRLLNGQYQIIQQLQRGGFAITYLARNSLERLVVIKECYPSGMCQRFNGMVQPISARIAPQFEALKRQFVREALTMASLRHPQIVEVHQVFEENNSAYIALDYAEGIDLITLLQDEPKRLTPGFLDSTLRQALEAIRCIHDHGVLHRDIAPDNIRVNAADHITLIDFGAAQKQGVAGGQAAESLIAVKDGYSPSEFYVPDAMHDQSSDLYSLGATFYHLITGEAPPNCQERLAAIQAGTPDPYVPLGAANWNCGCHILVSVDRALNVDRRLRPQTTRDWLTLLDDLPQTRPSAAPAPLSDANLEAAVSQLVRETNNSLAMQMPKEPRRRRSVQKTSMGENTKEAPRKQWVDIDGAPICDIDVWLSEQRHATRKRAVIETVAEPAEPIVEPVQVSHIEPVSRPDAGHLTRGMKSLFAGLSLRGLNRSTANSTT